MSQLPRHPFLLAVRPIVEALGATLVPADEREPGDDAQNFTSGGRSPTSERASKVAFGSAPITFAVSTTGN